MALLGKNNAYAAGGGCEGYQQQVVSLVEKIRKTPSGGVNDPEEKSTKPMRLEAFGIMDQAKTAFCNPPAEFMQKFPTSGIGNTNLSEFVPINPGENIAPPPQDFLTFDLGGMINGAISGVTGAINGAIGSVTGAINGAVGGVTNSVNKATSTATNAANTTASTAKKAASTATKTNSANQNLNNNTQRGFNYPKTTGL